MKVLVVTQHYLPETGGTPNRLASLASGLVRAEHEVQVVTAKPNHPEGVIREDYRGPLWLEACHEGITTLHTWVFTRPEKTLFTRLAFYCSFTVMSVLSSFRLRDDYDVVLASSPPLTVGVTGWILSRLKGARFVFDVRDLWPDLAVAMGELHNSLLIRIAEQLEEFLYQRADGITAATKGFLREIRASLDELPPMLHLPNGTEPERFRHDDERDRLRRDLDLPDGFLVTYAGNIGICQGLGHILEAADRARDKDLDVTILFVGEGPAKPKLVEERERRELRNVLFRPRVQLETAIRYMAASDALLVPLAHHEIFQKFVPSKLFDSMAVGRPVLLSVDGEAREILEDANAGLYYPAEDAVALVDQIKRLMDDPSAAERMGARGREYVKKNFDRSRQARKMVRFLERLAGSSGSRPGPPNGRFREGHQGTSDQEGTRGT